jgi:DNA polymerase-3 subunit beta
MFIRCEQAELIKKLNIVTRAVPARTTMDVLTCVVIKTIGDTINMTANNMELGIETLVIGSVEEQGTVALNAKIFTDIIRKLTGSEVTIETDTSLNTTIKCGKSVFKIPGRETTDYPPLPEIQKKYNFTISQFVLKDLINRTIFSVSTNENVKVITGEYFEAGDGELKVTALDNHRIAIRKAQIPATEGNVNAIIPAKTLNEVSKILTGEIEDTVELTFGDGVLSFEFNDTLVVTRLIEGNYLDVNRMITGDYQTKITINRQELIDSLSASLPLIPDSDNTPVVFDITDGNLNIRVRTNLGSLSSDTPITKDGEDIKIGFNPNFLIDALKAIEDESIDMYFLHQRAPGFIKNEDGTYEYVVLPVNFVDN